MNTTKILVIEDTLMNMELVTDLLEAAGCGVLQAADATTGIALARKHQPDLILMDISLPGMDGLAATRALKDDKSTWHIPVVALTAHAMKGDADKSLEAGCVAYFTKPLDTRTFIGKIRQIMRSTPAPTPCCT